MLEKVKEKVDDISVLMLEEDGETNEALTELFKTLPKKSDVEVNVIHKKQQKNLEKFYSMIMTYYHKMLSQIKKTVEKVSKEDIEAKKNIDYRYELETFVDECLRDSDHYNIKRLLDNGYQLTEDQNNTLKNLMQNYLEKREILDKIVEQGGVYTAGMIAEALSNSSFSIYCNNILKQYAQLRRYENNPEENKEKIKLLQSEIKDRQRYASYKREDFDNLFSKVNEWLEDKDKRIEVFKEWLKIINSKNKQSPYFALQYLIKETYDLFAIEVIPELNKENIRNLKKLFIDFKNRNLYKDTKDLLLVDQVVINLDNKLGILNQEEKNEKIDEMIEKARSVYLDERIKKNTIKQQKKITASINLEKLPNDIKTIMKDIETTYKKICADKSGVNTEILINIERFIDKRIPEMLQKYFSFDPECRETFTDNGDKTPKELLKDSLLNVKKYFDNVNEQRNISNLSDLSATNKYTKKFTQ